MNSEVSNYWFPAKRYGWGWGLPRRWQGWVVLIVYFALVGAATFSLPQQLQFMISVAVLTILLVAVCWLKGEPPRWRWGDAGAKR
ncbi:MAG TPA: hypothetical protein VGM81_15890 [Burkholderiaceae bacterium]|jgi:uncharacterized membrane protein YhaH (DUF805 family)